MTSRKAEGTLHFYRHIVLYAKKRYPRGSNVVEDLRRLVSFEKGYPHPAQDDDILRTVLEIFAWYLEIYGNPVQTLFVVMRNLGTDPEEDTPLEQLLKRMLDFIAIKVPLADVGKPDPAVVSLLIN